jgi:hypothetical protein
VDAIGLGVGLDAHRLLAHQRDLPVDHRRAMRKLAAFDEEPISRNRTR